MQRKKKPPVTLDQTRSNGRQNAVHSNILIQTAAKTPRHMSCARCLLAAYKELWPLDRKKMKPTAVLQNVSEPEGMRYVTAFSALTPAQLSKKRAASSGRKCVAHQV